MPGWSSAPSRRRSLKHRGIRVDDNHEKHAINSATVVTSGVAPPVAGAVYLRATASGITITSITMTLSPAVEGSSTPPSDQLRAAVTTNQ